MEMGVDQFDTALGGLGGCPFIKGATGNIATEDTINLMNEMGIDTGVDLSKVAQTSKALQESVPESYFTGKLYKLEN
jgi:hydroxymethylglutaryl-CoA lyase